MSRKPQPLKKGKDHRMNIVIPSDIAGKLDDKVEELCREMPGNTVTRTDVVRMALYKFLNE